MPGCLQAVEILENLENEPLDLENFENEFFFSKKFLEILEKAEEGQP